MISKTESLVFLPLSTMKDELRIPPPADPLRPTVGTEHDELITGQICAAVSFVSYFTDRPTVAELDHAALRSAAIILVRLLYDGQRDLKKQSALYGLMDPFRRLAG